MVEVGSPWECAWNGKLVLLVVMVILSGSSKQCSAQSSNDAAAYLIGVENDVMRVAAQATANFNNTCGTFLYNHTRIRIFLPEKSPKTKQTPHVQLQALELVWTFLRPWFIDFL